MFQAGLGVVAFFLADDGDRLAAEAGKTRLDRGILGKLAVAGQRREFLEQGLGVIDEMRSLRVARDLRLLPGIELGIDFDDRLTDANLQPADFIGGVDALVFRCELLQLDDLAFEVGDRLFEVEIIVHEVRFRSLCPGRFPGSAPCRRSYSCFFACLARG